MGDQQGKQEKQKWVVNLPGDEYVLQQWLVRNGSAVQQGDKVATAVKKSTSPSDSTTTTATSTVVKHKRPKKRKRVSSDEQHSSTASTNDSKPASTVKKLAAYLPPQTQQDTVTIVAPAGGLLRIEAGPSLLNPLKIASIEPCLHPAILGGLCAVCGASMGPQEESVSTATLIHPPSALAAAESSMSQVTVSGGVTMTISETEAQEISQQTSRKLLQQEKLSLVLDLDHTLVHATADPRARAHYLQRPDVRTLILPILVEGQTRWMQHYVKLRPHVEAFLKQAQELYEVSVYTAGTRTYAEHVCMLLSRNMVGATHDEEELQRLRHAVLCAEYELASHNKKKETAGANDVNGDNRRGCAPSAGTTDKPAATSPGAKVEVDYKSVDYRGFVFVVHKTYGLVLLHCTRKKKKGPHFQLPGGHIDEPEFVTAAQESRDGQTQLRLASRAGAARELYEETGMDVRNQLDRLKPAVLRNEGEVDEHGKPILQNELKHRLYFFLSVTDDDFWSSDKGDSDAGKMHPMGATLGSEGSQLMLKLSHEHQGWTFEKDPNKSTQMLAVHSGGQGATAWRMSMARNALGSDDSKKDVTKEGASVPSQEEGSAALPKEEATNGNVDNNDNDKATISSDKDSSNKKRVSFGEPPQDTKTDEMTPERLEELKKELQEAEKLEQKALEVRQQLFGSRIVSRTDVEDLGRDVKSLERIFPCGGTMAVIVDDREDVWANAPDNSKPKGEPPENLLLIRPYHWKPFLGFADVNNAAGEDISGESITTEDEDDDALLWTLDVLKRMHKKVYTAIKENGNSDITVPPLLREMRQEVLQGCTLVFSGLIPLHEQNRRFPRPNVVRYGESLGARVLDNVDDAITHMVAARDGTDKIHKARRVPGCVVVKPSWLMECVWTITRRDVTPHLLGKPGPAVPLQESKEGTAETAGNDSSSSDDDDDDVAAMLEADMAG